jgi:hypothetical protein
VLRRDQKQCRKGCQGIVRTFQSYQYQTARSAHATRHRRAIRRLENTMSYRAVATSLRSGEGLLKNSRMVREAIAPDRREMEATLSRCVNWDWASGTRPAGVSGTLVRDDRATADFVQRDLQLIARSMGRCQGISMARDKPLNATRAPICEIAGDTPMCSRYHGRLNDRQTITTTPRAFISWLASTTAV